jgi:hypothetical protein
MAGFGGRALSEALDHGRIWGGARSCSLQGKTHVVGEADGRGRGAIVGTARRGRWGRARCGRGAVAGTVRRGRWGRAEAW